MIYYDHDTSVASNLDLDKMWILHRRPYMSEDSRRKLRDRLEKIFVPVYSS